VSAHLKRWWASAAVITALVLALDIGFHVVHSGRVAYSGRHPIVPAQRTGEHAPIVSDEFDLDGWRGNVEVVVSAPALQHGAFDVEGSLVSSSSGASHAFAVRSSDAAPSDLAGAHAIEHASVRIGAVPGGRYRLRLEPRSKIADPNGMFDVVVKRQLA